jgi:hypothetical protein
MKYGQNLKLGDAHVTSRNIQEVQASKLGDARGTSSSSTKISGHLSRHYILLLHKLCVFLGASLFLLPVLFAAINDWTPTCFFWRRHTPFSLSRTL